MESSGRGILGRSTAAGQAALRTRDYFLMNLTQRFRLSSRVIVLVDRLTLALAVGLEPGRTDLELADECRLY
jgi:hypothetical protein